MNRSKLADVRYLGKGKSADKLLWERKATRKVVGGDENVKGNRSRAKGDGLKNDWNVQGLQGLARKIQRWR
jgi:hypothetical protein